MTIQPLGDYVLLAPSTPEEKTAAGLYRPDTAQEEKSQEAEVIAVSNNDAIAKGDRVLYKKFSGDTFTHDGKDFVIVKNEDIIALMK